MPRILRWLGVALYCVALWVVFDLIYSNFIHTHDPPVRTADVHYGHGLLPNVASFDGWGARRYPLNTNSLGFRDARVRDVPLKPETHRVVVIGDSFTEGVGSTYEASFVGLLAAAGEMGPGKVEFLNAGVVSYSPVIYLQKIKYLLDRGLAFNDVIVLPDISDVQDEATGSFCLDDAAEYRTYCRSHKHVIDGRKLRSHFVVAYRTQLGIEHIARQVRGGRQDWIFNRMQRAGWTIPGFNTGNAYAPLGVEGGITRNLRNMSELASLLETRHIGLTVAVYPWPMQLAHNDRDSRHVAMWREFCRTRCKRFMDMYPVFFAAKDKYADWYERYFVVDDVHFSSEGNRLIFNELARHMLPAP
jgi:hypothetical protein